MTFIAYAFPKLQAVEDMVRRMFSPISQHPSTVNMSKRPKHSWNVHYSTFIIVVDPCEQKGPGMYLF